MPSTLRGRPPLGFLDFPNALSIWCRRRSCELRVQAPDDESGALLGPPYRVLIIRNWAETMVKGVSDWRNEQKYC